MGQRGQKRPGCEAARAVVSSSRLVRVRVRVRVRGRVRV
jgi:hypothetical protein